MKAPIKLKALPPKEAIKFFRQKGFKIGFDHQDVFAQEHQAAFTVAKAMRIDLLRDIRDAVDGALANGTTFNDFQKTLQPTLVQKGWWGRADIEDPVTGTIENVQVGSPRRLKVIYDTNIRTAHQEGQWERIQDRKEDFPYLIYDANNSIDPDPDHSQWDGLVLRVDDIFWQNHLPVKRHGCNCRVRQLSRKQLERRKLKVGRSPKVKRKEFINKRTGEVRRIPQGVSPSFHYAPGKRKVHLQNHIRGLIDNTQQGIAQQTVKELVNSRAIGLWLDKPEGTIPVAVIDKALMSRINAKQRSVVLSDATMQKQQRNHPELTQKEYALLPDILERGAIIQQDKQRLVFFHTNRRLYKAVMKTTKDGSENFLVSFHRTDEKEFDREKSRGKVIRKEK